MKLQWLGQRRCAANEAVNPETGQCYRVCAEGEIYDPQGGCRDANWFREHWKFLTAVGLLSGYAYWRFLR